MSRKPRDAANICHFLVQVNTFQVVLATDEVSSFVLFLYDNIAWDTANPRVGNASTPAQVN